jgi:Fic family protein
LRSFERDLVLIDRVPGTLVKALSQVDTSRGLERLNLAQVPGLLQQLAMHARVQSVKASSALEGVVVPDERRADRIINGAAERLRTRSEQELAGYRDALDYVWTNDWRPVNVGLILHLHRLLFGHTAVSGGAFKTENNLVVDRLPDGQQVVRFRPVSAASTPWAVEDLVARYSTASKEAQHHPLLLIGLFVLDLLVIHPFEDGNGRVARVLTNALLDEAGYGVARYVSLEQLVAEADDAYYASLLASTHGWHEGQHDPWPWLRYLVEQLGNAYSAFEHRVAAGQGQVGKRDRVKDYVLGHSRSSFRIADVRAALPGISDATIRNALDELRQADLVEVDGPGRSATWSRRQ